LPQRHGFPARLVVAGLYGYVSATKWLQDIELTRLEDLDGYWIPRGWAKEAPIKIASRIDVPRRGDPVVAGPLAIAGVAWAPSVGIKAVEVRIDGGEWMQARLGNVASNNTWVQWMVNWTATKGPHSVEVRAIDERGRMQIAESAPPDPDGATGYHKRNFTAE
jgi:DMSO/TMAO reductase YedYZ molybdopterin-dependent catalytic subunit